MRIIEEGAAVPQPPKLTDEQRRQNLEKAAYVRGKRAEIREELKKGDLRLQALLRRDDDIVGKMRVASVLEAMPGVGKVRARKLMERIGISLTRRVQGLGAKQREALLREFSDT